MKTEGLDDSSTGPEVKNIPLPTNDDNIAAKELKAVGEEAYSRESRQKEHTRSETFKDALHIYALRLLAIAAFILIAGVFIWAWHFLMPTPWRWLTPDQIDELHRMMSSALFAVFVRELSRKFFK